MIGDPRLPIGPPRAWRRKPNKREMLDIRARLMREENAGNIRRRVAALEAWGRRREVAARRAG